MDKKILAFYITTLALTALAITPFALAVEDEMAEILALLEEVFDETMSTLDNAWDIALKFKDPNYVYDPSELNTSPG